MVRAGPDRGEVAPPGRRPAARSRKVRSPVTERSGQGVLCPAAAGSPIVAPMSSTIPVNPMTRVGGFIALTKPRIIELLLVTTVPTMVVAARGMPADLADRGHRPRRHPRRRRRQRHQHVRRPRHRPGDAPHPAAGRWSPASSAHGGAHVRHRLEVVAFVWLWALGEPASAPCWPSSACLFYVFVYTLWLKRTSSRNIVIGGAAGAVPVLIGWSSVDRPPRLGADRAVRSSSSSGRRRTSGRWPSSTATTTPRSTCRCSRRWPACAPPASGSSPTRSSSGR